MNMKKNYFKFLALAFVSWSFMLIFMASTQLNIIDAVHSMAYKNFDLLVSSTSWDPTTLLIVLNGGNLNLSTLGFEGFRAIFGEQHGYACPNQS